MMFIGWIVLRVTMNPALAPPFEHEALPAWQRWKPLLIYVLPLILIFVIVVAAMAAGWSTPTEAAAVGAVATVLVAWIYRALSWSNLMRALMGTAGISGIILFIIVGATTFAQILTFSGATHGLVETIKTAQLEPWLVLGAMMLILLVLGCFVDQVSMMLICLPFFMPLVATYGFDPVWFGVLFLFCMQLGLLTPPFGMLLFVMKSVAPKEIPMREVWVAATPYVLMGLAGLIAVILWPPLATWLPKVLFR
jgi:tripartite ATP-independent transporter DctM subunit